MSGFRAFASEETKWHVPFVSLLYRARVLCFLCGKEAPFARRCREYDR